MAKKKKEKLDIETSNNQQKEQKSFSADRSYRVSKFVHVKLKVSLFFDSILEKISTPLVHRSLMIIILLFALLLAFSILFYHPDELVDDADVDEISTNTTGKDKINVLTPEMLESAVKSATLVVTNEKAIVYPFKKVNAWGEIKPTDDKWWNKALFDAYVFLLDQIKISDLQDTRKVIDSLCQELKTYYKISPDSNTARFLKTYFQEYLLLRTYEHAESSNPLEIINNLGGNEYDVVFLVLATLSKIGVSTEISQITYDDKSVLIIQLKDKETDIDISQIETQGESKKLNVIEFLEKFLKFHISKTVGIPKLVTLYTLIENFHQSVEIYRELSKLYQKWEKNTEDPALKKKCRDKSLFYQNKVPIDNPEDLFRQAQRRFEDGNIAESWEKFNALVKKYPDYESAKVDSQYYYLAVIGINKYDVGAIEAKKLNSFLTHLDSRVEKHRQILTKSAYLFFDHNQYNLSIEILNNLEKLGFGDVQLYLTRSQICKTLKNNMPAISNLRAAIELDTANRKLRAQLIQMLIDEKLYLEAYNECDKSADSPAKMIYTLKIGIAIAEEYLNDILLAEKMLIKYVQLNPEDADARKKLEKYR